MNTKIFWFLALVVGFCLLNSRSWAQITLPNPPESILVIYYADATQKCADGSTKTETAPNIYPTGLMSGVTTALGAIPAPYTPNVDLLLIHENDSGIYTELQNQYPAQVAANPTDPLVSWCQVWDLRLQDGCNNIGWSAGETPADLVTNTGANNDFQIFEAYVKAGGSLYLQGEHHDFYARNNNLIELLNNLAASPIVSTVCGTYLCPDVNTGNPYTDNNPFTANYSFNTIYNNLTGANAITIVYAGGIPPADYGSGLPLIMIPGLNYTGTTGGLMMMWEGGALNSTYGAGKVVAAFESNTFVPVANSGAEGPYSIEALQNVYAELTGCQRYTVTKTFASPSVCVGSSSSFSICVDNTGTQALTNYSISDTIPTCLTYTSFGTSGVAPSGNGNSSNLYWWNYTSIPAGQSACVTVNFTATTFPPCP